MSASHWAAGRARWLWAAGALLVVAGLALTGVLLGGGDRHAATGPARPTPPVRPSASASPPAGLTMPPNVTLIAQLTHDVARYAGPDERTRDGIVPGSWLGAHASLPVIDARPGFLRVRLAQRPNFSTAWIRAADAHLVTSDYHIVVDVHTRHLKLYKGGKVTLDAPAGIGTPDDPTPTGEFFLALFAQPPGPGYGDFIVVTSAHSTTITDWDNSGDAVVGIHGPLGADAVIGTTGAAVSHGCVRLHLPDLAKLRSVPAGTPISVTGSPVL